MPVYTLDSKVKREPKRFELQRIIQDNALTEGTASSVSKKFGQRSRDAGLPSRDLLTPRLDGGSLGKIRRQFVRFKSFDLERYQEGNLIFKPACAVIKNPFLKIRLPKTASNLLAPDVSWRHEFE